MDEKIKAILNNLNDNPDRELSVEERLTISEAVCKEQASKPLNAFVVSLRGLDEPYYYQGTGAYGHSFAKGTGVAHNIEALEEFIYSLPDEIYNRISIEFVHCDGELGRYIENSTQKAEIINSFAGRDYPRKLLG